MLRALPAGLLALALTGCGGSKPIASPSFLPPPPALPPAALPDPCLPTSILSQADHSLNSADAERAIRNGDADLARCRTDRDRYRDAWPLQAGLSPETAGPTGASSPRE